MERLVLCRVDVMNPFQFWKELILQEGGRYLTHAKVIYNRAFHSLFKPLVKSSMSSSAFSNPT